MKKILKRKIVEIELSKISPPPVVDRLDIDPGKIKELAASISELTLLQPILLRPIPDGFEIVAGHRRFLAHQLLGLSVIDSVVQNMTEQEAAIIRATENLAREDLTPFEESVIFSNLIEHYNMTMEQVALKFGYKPGTIRRRLDIIKMPPVLQKAVHAKQISVSVAEELWSISDEGDLNYYLKFAIESGCTKETARGWCKDWRDSKRRQEAPGGEGGRVFAPNEPRPVYVTCDLCVGPMEIGKETVLRVCPDCFAIIKQNM